MKLKDYKVKVNIVDFGAKSGLDELQTDFIQAAIDHCFKMGGGEIQIPKGEFLCGGIRLRSNTTLHLLEGAKLIGSRDCEDYFVLQKDKVEPVEPYILTEEERINGRSPDGLHYGRRWLSSLIKIYKAKNVAIIGEKDSVIDGRDCYDGDNEEGFRGPHCICVGESKNLYFHGYTIVNSANWAHCIWNAKNITCREVTIKAGHDGFDVFGCTNVLVENCDIFSGDDSIAGYSNYKVNIRNCNLSSSCSAFRFAGTCVTVTDCKIEGNSPYVHRYTLNKEEQITNNILSDEENPNHRYRMKSFYTYYGDNRLVIKRPPSKMVFDRCEIKNPTKFFHYNFSGSEEWSSNRPLVDITFKNMKVENVNLPMIAYGDKAQPVTITMENVELTLGDDFMDDCLLRTANLKKVTFKNFKLNNFKGNTLIKNYGKNNGQILLENTNFSSELITVFETDDKFEVEMI